MEKCINCHSAVGMASSHAVGLWDGDTYHGGVCSNCTTYPERLSTNARVLLDLFAPGSVRP